MTTLDEYNKMVEDKICGFCDGNLGAMEYYDHDGGFEVEGFDEKQWLFKTCLKCGHQWSLIHLGVQR